MDERRLAEFIGSKTGEAVDVRSSRRVAFEPLRTAWDVDTSAGRFMVHTKIDGSPGLAPDQEFTLMGTLADAGFPVARLRWSEPTGEVLGQPFFVVDHVDGKGIADDPTAPTAAVGARELMRLHNLKPEAHLPPIDAEHATATQIELWRNIGKSAGGSRIPLLDAAEMWLHNNVPLLRRASLVHGHPGTQNILTSAEQVVAVTGWEYAHVGSPVEDWSYLASGNGSGNKAQEWRALIEQEIGARVTPDEWSYWDAFNLFKRACISRTYLAQFESGADRSPGKMIAGTAVFHALLRHLTNFVAVV